MNAEKLVRRTRARLIAWRILGDFVGLFRLTLFGIHEAAAALVGVFEHIAGFVQSIEQSVFYLELAAARELYGLTGVDPALGCGNPNRYISIRKTEDELVEAMGGDGEEV